MAHINSVIFSGLNVNSVVLCNQDFGTSHSDKGTKHEVPRPRARNKAMRNSTRL